MKRVILMTTLLTLAFTLPQPAAAQTGSLTRSFVSSAGVDSNPCTITQPCATFAQAYTKLAANGIIAALDPGKYGPITIIGPVTINGNGWATITGPAGGTAITVNAGPNDAVKLSGLELDGANTSEHGISFVGGKSLIISNCIVRQFYYGIVLSAVADVQLVDSAIENNLTYGVLDAPVSTQGTFTFDRVRFSQNSTALSLDDSNASPTSYIYAVGLNSVAMGNHIAFETNATQAFLELDSVALSSNYESVDAEKGHVTLTRSSFLNGGFFYRATNAEVFTFGNNSFDLNAPDQMTTISPQ
jgi:hypothetical protein